MPRYYFDTKDGGITLRDEAGTIFEDHAAMRSAAMALLPCVATDEMRDAESAIYVVRVRNEGGSIVFHASLALLADWID